MHWCLEETALVISGCGTLSFLWIRIRYWAHIRSKRG